MNSGCFGKEFKDVLLSVQVMDYDGKVYTIDSKNINFEYRKISLPKNLIFLSASFKTFKKDKKEIEDTIYKFKQKKENTERQARRPARARGHPCQRDDVASLVHRVPVAP